MSGDNIKDLKINKKEKATSDELELAHKLFKINNTIGSVINPNYLKCTVIASILFGLLTLPYVSKLLESYIKNIIVLRLILILIFALLLYGSLVLLD